jgi:hypothetical protein
LTNIITKSGPGGEQNTFGLPTGDDIEREFVAIFTDQRSALLAYLEPFKAWTTLEYKWGLPSSWPSWDSLGLGVSSIVDRVKGFVADIWEKAGEAFLMSLGIDPDVWDVTVPPLDGMIARDVMDLANEVNGTTSTALANALAEVTRAVAGGALPADQAADVLAKDVNEIFDHAVDSRADTIARTEASRAYHAAMREAASEYGDVSGWKWVCAANACPICLEIEAECQFVPIGRPFAIVGNNPTYQTIDMPPCHPNCACTAEPIMAGDEPPDWGDTLIQPRGLATATVKTVDVVSIGRKAWPVPKRFPRPMMAKRINESTALSYQ